MTTQPSRMSLSTVSSVAASLVTIEDKLNSILDMMEATKANIAEIRKDQQDMSATIGQCQSNMGEVKQLVSGLEKKVNVETELRHVSYQDSLSEKPKPKKKRGFCSCMRGVPDESEDEDKGRGHYFDDYDPLVHGLREWSPLPRRNNSFEQRRRTVTEMAEDVRRQSRQKQQTLADLARPP